MQLAGVLLAVYTTAMQAAREQRFAKLRAAFFISLMSW
jgi:hypothetical protein